MMNDLFFWLREAAVQTKAPSVLSVLLHLTEVFVISCWTI